MIQFEINFEDRQIVCITFPFNSGILSKPNLFKKLTYLPPCTLKFPRLEFMNTIRVDIAASLIHKRNDTGSLTLSGLIKWGNSLERRDEPDAEEEEEES